MGFIRSAKGSIISDYFMLLEDHANLKEKHLYDVALYDTYLVIKAAPMNGQGEATLQYSQITGVYRGPRIDITEVKKSTFGRAAAGGLLFGPVGALVGAMSSTTNNGKKQRKAAKTVFLISYTSSTGEDKVIQFEDTRMYKGRKLAKTLRELCGISENGTSDNPAGLPSVQL